MKAIYERVIAAQVEEFKKPDHHPSTFWVPLESPCCKKFNFEYVASTYSEDATDVMLEIHEGVLNLFVYNTDGTRNSIPAAQIGVKYPDGSMADIWIGLSENDFDRIGQEFYY
jgi:hypothetical protein